MTDRAAVESLAAKMAYEAGLGASEWPAFVELAEKALGPASSNRTDRPFGDIEQQTGHPVFAHANEDAIPNRVMSDLSEGDSTDGKNAITRHATRDSAAAEYEMTVKMAKYLARCDSIAEVSISDLLDIIREAQSA